MGREVYEVGLRFWWGCVTKAIGRGGGDDRTRMGLEGSAPVMIKLGY